MNGLTLRVSGAGIKKRKNTFSYATVTFSDNYKDRFYAKCKEVDSFLVASSVDKQLAILKDILEAVSLPGKLVDEAKITFLAIVFLQAEVKHPVKCFVTRYVMKSSILQQPFSKALSEEIAKLTTDCHSNYKDYINVIYKVVTCIENFPAGGVAIKNIEIELAEYLKNGLTYIVNCLREMKSLSPTEKNEIFNLTHTILRLVLYIVQKVSSSNVDKLIPMLKDIRFCLRELLCDEDVPMDTKSVCGIVHVTMHMLENGSDSWIDILGDGGRDENIHSFMMNDASELSIYSAVATVVPTNQLQSQIIDNTPVILFLTSNVIAIGERTSSDSTFNLGVTRTLLQISKGLDKTTNVQLGLRLVEVLLMYVWPHLDHYMDSVRHLSAQVLGNVVKYCTWLEGKGDSTGVDKVFTALQSLDRSRRSFYVSLAALIVQLGASRVLARLPTIVAELMDSLQVQAVQAVATTALETLQQRHMAGCSSQEAYERWVAPALAQVAARQLDQGQLAVLEGLLANAVRLNGNILDYIVPYIKQTCEEGGEKLYDKKCVLMLLSVARKCGVVSQLPPGSSGQLWRSIVSYDVLRRAAVDQHEQTRVLSLSLIVESPKSTEVFAPEELDFVLYFLKYNANSPVANFRQLTLSLMKKFMKRFEDSHKAYKRQNVPLVNDDQSDHYVMFLRKLREQCFDNLLPGANYGRRCVALQLLVWCNQVNLDGYDRRWKEDDVEKLLQHLEDSYESNKALALDVLKGCPAELLQRKTYRTSLETEDILRQASSVKPTDCVSAAYKLDLVMSKLPQNILEGEDNCAGTEAVRYVLLRRLLARLRDELAVCRGSVVAAARDAPMYGQLHCVRRVLKALEPQAIAEEASWSTLIAEIISTCMEVNAAVACVVNDSSPEGHLPCDMGVVTHPDSEGNVRLADGRPVTAQMVLLCAWRSVKEVSLLLGEMCSRLAIRGEGAGGTLDGEQVVRVGRHFTRLLAETKHRGAFEQAYVGFSALLARLWRCRSQQLHGLPEAWLNELMLAIQRPGHGRLCATRRSAGLPFMIQALVTTELQVRSRPSCFRACMETLLRLARTRGGDTATSTKTTTTTEIDTKSDKTDTNAEQTDANAKQTDTNAKQTDTKSKETDTNSEETDNNSEETTSVETRVHCANVLRALYRNAALHDAVAPHVADGLLVALEGFDATTWEERNAWTLALSALAVRVFGVARSRDTERLPARNRMTGRLFFLRYPALYDFMLNKLKEASLSQESQLLRPSLYPILLLLARLYPSSLEGTVSNLKLVAFVPYVRACAASPVLKTRQLAARALLPLVSPDLLMHSYILHSTNIGNVFNRYVSHLESMLEQLCNQDISKNYCHGLLLQINRLLDNRPENLEVEESTAVSIRGRVEGSWWGLRQAAGYTPCYPVADEQLKMINLLLWRFPSLLPPHMMETITQHLDSLLFNDRIPPITSGRDVCLANATYLYFIILNIQKNQSVRSLTYKCLTHKSYEVVLATLNYILIMKKEIEIDDKFLEHLSLVVNIDNWIELKNDNYFQLLSNIVKSEYLECCHKALKVLSLYEDTQRYVIQSDDTKASDETILEALYRCIENGRESMTHIYVHSLTDFMSRLLRNSKVRGALILEAIRVMFSCSWSYNSDETRSAVVDFLDRNMEVLMALELNDLVESEKFEYKATLYCTLVTVLEDGEAALARRAGRLAGGGGALLGRLARDQDGPALLLLLALLDFKSLVVMNDEGNDECRVFDQNEKYNVYLEETVWTRACAQKIKKIYKKTDEDIINSLIKMSQSPRYSVAMERLCDINLILFKNPNAKVDTPSFVVNPKIEVFIKELMKDNDCNE